LAKDSKHANALALKKKIEDERKGGAAPTAAAPATPAGAAPAQP